MRASQLSTLSSYAYNNTTFQSQQIMLPQKHETYLLNGVTKQYPLTADAYNKIHKAS